MKLFTRIIISLFFLLSTPQLSFSQGCSDAGFCTMGAMKPDQHYAKKFNILLKSIEVGQYVGLTRFDDTILAYTVDANIGIGNRVIFQFLLPYQITRGTMANTGGISDVSLSLTYGIIQKENLKLNLTVGAKLPTGNSELTTDGRPLPMYYQPGLGTYDIVVGTSIVSKKWLLAFGYQKALNSIDNKFIWGDWQDHPLEKTALTYPIAQDLQRGTDVMLRLERNFRFTNFNFNLGLLPIYRLNEDVVKSPQTGERVQVSGSDGLALSFLYGFGYRLSVKSGIKVMFGSRVIKRKKNPDGLSREFVNTIGYEYRF